MKENKIIRYGILLSRVIYWLCILFFAGLIIVTFYWHINAVAFSAVGVSESFKVGYGINDFQLYTSENIPADVILLSELNYGMMYWILVRGGFFFTLTLLIVRKIILILHSIENLKTFYHGNIQHFRDLARLGFTAFIVSCFNFSYINGELHINLGLVFGPLFFSMACLILGEVFREGKLLLEDKNLII